MQPICTRLPQRRRRGIFPLFSLATEWSQGERVHNRGDYGKNFPSKLPPSLNYCYYFQRRSVINTLLCLKYGCRAATSLLKLQTSALRVSGYFGAPATSNNFFY